MKKEGCLEINWLSDTFRCQWNVGRKEEGIEINTSWYGIAGNIEGNLNRYSNIYMNKCDFINECERVIHNIIIALQGC